MNALPWRKFALFATVFLGAALFTHSAFSQSTTAQRDWKKHPAIAEVDTTQDIYAVGDVHGDYERLISLFVAAKIMPGDPGAPEKAQWSAGKGVLVCTGDLIDKWSQSTDVIILFRTLQIEAARAGGKVIVTMGNHEAEFLADPSKKKVAEFRKDLERRGLKSMDVALGTDTAGIGQWLRSLPIAARVNDWFFVHAGNTAHRSLPQLRTDLMAGIDKEGFKAPVLMDESSLLLARMHPQPWWETPTSSGESKKTPPLGKESLAKCVHALGVKHLVIGHQPSAVTFADNTKRSAGEMFQYGDGLLFLIDTGMSRGIGLSTGAVLHLRRTGKTLSAQRIDAMGKSHELWSGAK